MIHFEQIYHFSDAASSHITDQNLRCKKQTRSHLIIQFFSNRNAVEPSPLLSAPIVDRNSSKQGTQLFFITFVQTFPLKTFWLIKITIRLTSHPSSPIYCCFVIGTPKNNAVAKATHPRYVENVTRMSNSMANLQLVNVVTLLRRSLGRNVKGSYQMFFFLLQIIPLKPFGKATLNVPVCRRIEHLIRQTLASGRHDFIALRRHGVSFSIEGRRLPKSWQITPWSLVSTADANKRKIMASCRCSWHFFCLRLQYWVSR